MEGYITLTAAEFNVVCTILGEHRRRTSKNYHPIQGFPSDFFGPPWYYGDDGNLYIQEVN